MDTSFGNLPLSFEPNQGQSDPQVKFLARGRGYTLFLTQGEAVFVLRKAKAEVEAKGEEKGKAEHASRFTHDAARIADASRDTLHASRDYEQTLLRMKLEGANPSPRASGLEPLPGIVNYFIGSDPKKWRTNIPTYKKVEYKDIYPGIDLAYYGNQGKLEYDLVVAPGADPNQIKLAFEGADKIDVDPASGDLILTLQAASSEQRAASESELPATAANQQIRLQKPLVYQLDDKGHKTLVAGNYVVRPANSEQRIANSSELPATSYPLPAVGIQLASYDATKPLVIDPVLFFSTYLGGTGNDQGRGIAVDAAGNAYVTGETTSGSGTFTAFPGASGSAIQSSHGNGLTIGVDAFVTKVNAAGTALLYSTYLGGTGGDVGYGIAVDAAGSAYVAGETSTPLSGFPGTASSTIQPTYGGGANDAFVTKLNATGTAIVYSTYLGGSGEDRGKGIAVDAAGNAYVTGGTLTPLSGFPGTAGSTIQPTNGGFEDAFVTKIDAVGTALLYSTYLGGSATDWGNGITVDATGNAYVTGETSTPVSGFPGTAGSTIQPTHGGSFDAFVTKLNATGTAIVYSTY
ncbi:MAG: SBBP repeat-containing protein, partial [Candidatus Methylomirabilis sp.]